MSDTDREYLPPSQLARMFGVHARSLERWAREGRVHTIPTPRRRRGRLYHRGDVERLAHVMPAPAQLEAAPSDLSTALVLVRDLLSRLDDAQRRVEQAMLEVGKLQGQLAAQTKLLEVAERDRQRLVEILAEREH